MKTIRFANYSRIFTVCVGEEDLLHFLAFLESSKTVSGYKIDSFIYRTKEQIEYSTLAGFQKPGGKLISEEESFFA